MKTLTFFLALAFTVAWVTGAKAQLNCTSAALVTLGTTIKGSTTTGTPNVSTYNYDPWWQLTGPETVHKLEWTGGEVSIKLGHKSAALDLILLRSCNNNDFIASGGGNSGTQESTIKTYLEAGTYYIVVDGWQLASGTYDLLVMQTLTARIDNKPRTFFLQDKTLYEQTGTTPTVVAAGVEDAKIYWGYVTNLTTGEGQEQDGLAIRKAGQVKPKLFLNGNFDTGYVKQMLFCSQKTLSLHGELVFNGTDQILAGCDVLRCENGQILAHQLDGQIKLYSSQGVNSWLDIAQIITVNNRTYYIKQADNTVWALSGTRNQATSIGTNAKLLQDNDNQLIKIDPQGNYQRWDGVGWSDLTPNYVGVSPQMTDEGFWCFMQAKPLLESSNIEADQKKGLTFDASGTLQMEPIPATGNCDRFLWRTKEVGGGKRLLINKEKGESLPLLLSASGGLTFSPGQGEPEWEVRTSDLTKYGTNAYQLTSAKATRALSFSGAVQTESPSPGHTNQTWVFQFNQLVKDYFLPLPTRANLALYYVDNSSGVDVNTSASAIGASYNKFLKGPHGVSFFATNTSSDWVIVNYYVVLTNLMNAVVAPKPTDPNVDPNLVKTLDALKGQSLIIISKNDVNSAVPKQFFLEGEMSAYDVGRLRGSAGYLRAKKWNLVSEELTNKRGIVNRPLDQVFRRFDHGVHEFTHALQGLCNWIAMVDANGLCNAERGRSSECFCYDTQYWFNSVGSSYTYPGMRAAVWFESPTVSGSQRASFMKKIFNEANTWMPPVDLRLDGYTPSGSPLVLCTTIATTKAGNWNDPTVWSCHCVPTSTDVVRVGHAVTVPANGMGNALRIQYLAGGRLVYGLGAKIQLAFPNVWGQPDYGPTKSLRVIRAAKHR